MQAVSVCWGIFQEGFLHPSARDAKKASSKGKENQGQGQGPSQAKPSHQQLQLS